MVISITVNLNHTDSDPRPDIDKPGRNFQSVKQETGSGMDDELPSSYGP